MKLRKLNVTEFKNVPNGTIVLVLMCVPETDRHDMRTGEVRPVYILYDSGMADNKSTITACMEKGWAEVYVLEV